MPGFILLHIKVVYDVTQTVRSLNVIKVLQFKSFTI